MKLVPATMTVAAAVAAAIVVAAVVVSVVLAAVAATGARGNELWCCCFRAPYRWKRSGYYKQF
jgi:hypothetical protein